MPGMNHNATHASPADLVLQGGSVLDGTGAPPEPLDLGVRDGRIAWIGPPGSVRGARSLDLSGLTVAPGFIDLHSHADLILLAGLPTQEALLGAKIRQGVTTVIVGNCGLGPCPVKDGSRKTADLLASINSWMTPDGVEPGPLSLGEYLDRLERDGTVLNAGTLAPHGPVRLQAAGLEPGPVGEDALRTMESAVDQAFQEGAFGLSTGLIYPPGMYSDTAELERLASVVAAHGRLFTSHIRGSSTTLLPAVKELIRIGRTSGAQVHHSHMEAVGERFWNDVPEMIRLEDQARADQVRISHDVFAYTRAATMMSAIFPPWSLAGGIPGLLARLADRAVREKIRRDIERTIPSWPPWEEGGWPHNLVSAVGWDGILVSSVGDPRDQEMVGRSLASLAAEAGIAPFDLVADLMLRQEGKVGQFVDQVSGRNSQVKALHSILRHPAAAVISDAEDFGRGSPHPAHAGAFARILRLAREEKVLDLPEAVRRMTSLPASILGLAGRGTIGPGAVADLVAFDPGRAADAATWDRPREPAVGIEHVLIHGEPVVKDGVYIGGPAGKILRAGNDARPGKG